jgi:ABC-type sugar transport system permease subunit
MQRTSTEREHRPPSMPVRRAKAAPPRNTLLRRMADNWMFYLCIAPFFLLFAIFGAYPILASLYYSFTRWDGLSDPVFVGFANYQNLFRDPTFLKVLLNTIYIWLGSTVITLALAFVLAFLVNHYILRFNMLFRVVFLFPMLVAPALTAIVVSALFSTNAGLVNTVLGLFAGHKVVYDWFASGEWLKPLIIFMIAWRWTGWHFILFLAGLQSIPTEVYEAARVDGASGPRIFRLITVPLMLPVILVSVVTATIGGLQVFDEPYVLTKGTGGTLQLGATLGLYQYQTAFQEFNFGLASAVSYVIFILVLIFSILNFRLIRRDQ